MDALNGGQFRPALPILQRDATREVASMKDNHSGPSIPARNEPSSLLERALLGVNGACLDYYVKHEPEEFKRKLGSIAKAIKNGGETPSLNALVAAGCDEQFLLFLLHPFSPTPVFETLKGIFYTPGPGNATALFKRKPGEVKRLLQRLGKIADDIEFLNVSFEYGWVLPMGEPELNRFWRLPETIRDYTRFMQHLGKYFGSGSEGVHNINKAVVTAYVKRETKRFHDKEVAALIGAVMGNCYAETDHKTWRYKHYKRLHELFNLNYAHTSAFPGAAE